MEEDMKNRKRMVAIFGIAALLGIGYFIPTIVMWIKDFSLLYEEKEVEIESIPLDSQNVDLLEALEVFSDMISNQMIVEVGDGFATTYAEAIKEQEVSVSNALYKNVQEFATILDVKESVELVEFSAQNFAIMSKGEEEKVYSIWVCEGKDKAGNRYLFWVDATLNKVMAFSVPIGLFGKGDEAVFVGIDRVIQYYDFASYGSPIHSYAEDIDDSLKYKYWSNELEILDKELNVMLSLKFYRNGDRFVFNVEPESADMMYYDAAELK